ncbi:probable BRE4 Protein involved in endocytosis [Rhynchosporium secalis]|uniref:Probable BRE4 Protein involved in endocytosis n=1 Tax=Rhynchosporium secalis TaxID=38038 RepID=A0A1E1M1V2_RHYSE|nr:probable BRE4 Protein involved in endocytosis [Rhynchosporium secalis]
MPSLKPSGEDPAKGQAVRPHLLFTAPSFGPRRRQTSALNAHDKDRELSQRPESLGNHHSESGSSPGKHGNYEKHEKHIRLPVPSGDMRSPASSIYMGSYTPRRTSRSRGSDRSPASSAPVTPRTSMSHSHLTSLLQDLDLDLETYGVEETRDGFFDASFFKPPKFNHENLMRDAEYTLPAAFQKANPLSPEAFFPSQWQDIKDVVKAVTTTRAGIKLTKSFLAFFIAYIICLVPVIEEWLGRYNYIMVISVIINHPGRTVGAQVDGAFLTVIGSATGLGWGAFALWLSSSTSVARRGYGGVLAAFLVVFMGTIAALRCYLVRFYQLVICAGVAISYTCLVDTADDVDWMKLFNFGIPWLLGQALSLLICCTIFPDAGARPLAVSLHGAFGVMQDALVIPQPDPLILHHIMASTFVNLSQAHRDLVLDLSITRFRPSDIAALRNLMQGVIRSLLSLKMETQLFDDFDSNLANSVAAEPRGRSPKTRTASPGVKLSSIEKEAENSTGDKETVIDIDTPNDGSAMYRTSTSSRAVRLVACRLADPTAKLLLCVRTSLARCDAVLMEMSGYRKYLGPPEDVTTDILGSLTKLRKATIKYDDEEASLMNNPNLPPTYSDHPEVVELFLFVHPIRQAARTVEELLVKVMEMQQQRRGWSLYLPSYPWSKALKRTNAQVRHDRGGLTAGFYFQSQNQLARTMQGMTNAYKPLPYYFQPGNVKEDMRPPVTRSDTIGKYEGEKKDSKYSKQKRFRYRLWETLHRLQGFETRFALKVVITTSLLSVPAWLEQSRGWWNQNESWWAVVVVWVMSHPRVGGNFQDLVTRCLCCILGAVWGGLAYGADNGNPFVMAVFAAIYMLPMIYRFTQSSHPRSGIVGCLSFTVVSLSSKAKNGLPSPVQIAWTRGLAFVVGVVAAVVVNWILWPFVARHELRKALSAMMIYSSIIYRGVVAKYVYFEKEEEPTKEDIARSEMLEGRLREGFVRIRQLMALTRHEIRLRGPFDPLPYSALIDGCERFFEYLVSVRQSSLFFHPHYMSDDEQAAESLLTYRRDAVAAILMNLYVLAGALRGHQKVPRYLPNAAAARKHLLSHMAELEAMQATTTTSTSTSTSKSILTLHPDLRTNNIERESRKWSQIYSYSYSQSLTGCVQQLEQLQKYTKEIVGERGFDPIDADLYEDMTHPP